MNGTHGRDLRWSSPQGIARLAADPAWQVTVLAGGRWATAERSFEHGGHHWVIGLTPAQSSVALIVWRDEEVIAHARGDETAMCSAALDWALTIVANREIADTAGTAD